MAIPKTFLIGATAPDIGGLRAYLEYTKQIEFLRDFDEAIAGGISPGMALCSFYAKLCYKSLVMGRNSNLTGIRDIEDNLIGVFKSGHGSVLEHCQLNFVTTGCSRVFSHELVRHRVGTAYSQTSGRYCTVEDAELVIPPELELSPELDEEGDSTIAEEMRAALFGIKENVARWRRILKLDDPGTPFSVKKRLTSALRRIMPNGATNEIGWSMNLRSLRHVIELRTSRHAEWEIRQVFHDVANIIHDRWPLMLYGGKRDSVDGLGEWTGLRV